MSNDETTDIKWLKQGLDDIKKDMRSGFTEIRDRLDMYQENFETKENAKLGREAIWQEVKKLDEVKADNETVNRIASDLEAVQELKNKIVWLVLSTVIVAILYLVIGSPL